MPVSACRRQWSARSWLRLCLSSFLLFVQLVLPQLQAKPALAQATEWWSTQWDYRVGLTVAANGHARTDKPAEIALNFTSLLNSLGQIGPFDTNSLRLIEVNRPYSDLISYSCNHRLVSSVLPVVEIKSV